MFREKVDKLGLKTALILSSQGLAVLLPTFSQRMPPEEKMDKGLKQNDCPTKYKPFIHISGEYSWSTSHQLHRSSPSLHVGAMPPTCHQVL